MRARWLQEDARGPVQGLALAPLLPVSWLYGLVASIHRGVYERGILRATQLPCHVVSVGNLGVGGSGKTPTAAWLAAALHARGHRVVLASRGYGRRGGDEVRVVSDGRFVRERVERVGDEPLLLAAHAPGVPVLVGRDRALAGWRALSAFGAEVLVLDDGFQHHRLHRDLDLVLFDGATGLGRGGCLPHGPKREPAGALRSAHALGVVDGPLPERDEERISQLAPDAFRFRAHRRPRVLRGLSGGQPCDPASLAERSVGLLSGLGRPGGLRRTVEALGARVVAQRSFGDHHRYRPSNLTGLADEAPLWVTTEKDALKIPASWARGADIRVLTIALEVDDARSFLDWIELRLREKPDRS
jgi:tetraacyldisaccharide 4'-kinase